MAVGDDDELRRRWDLSVAVAAKLLEEPPHSGQVWSMAWVLYEGEIPTD